jgi:hypothetical protein
MRMGLIYSNAIHVIAWIGEEADDSNFAINCLYNRAQMLLDHNLNTSKRPRRIGHTESGSGSERIFTVETPVSALFRRPYWKRVWIIQDISKGREVHFHCGLRSIEWGFLQTAIRGWELPNKQEVIALDYFRGRENEKQRTPPFGRLCPEAKCFWRPMLATRYMNSLVLLLTVVTLCQRQITSNRPPLYTFSF